MDLNFPLRFLKKLEIYQQIRKGQGLSKHKNLWKYEVAFLHTAYAEKHQHFNSFVNVRNNQFQEWIKRGDDSFTGKDYDHIIGNLLWKGYIEIKYWGEEGNIIVDKFKEYISDKKLTYYEVRPTPDGLLVGEVISEIQNKSWIIRNWNKYRYNLVVDTIWLLIFVGIGKILVPDLMKNLQTINIQVCCITLNYTKIALLTLVIIWPLTTKIFRKIHLILEKP